MLRARKHRHYFKKELYWLGIREMCKCGTGRMMGIKWFITTNNKKTIC
jgi:hypothetical protein